MSFEPFHYTERRHANGVTARVTRYLDGVGVWYEATRHEPGEDLNAPAMLINGWLVLAAARTAADALAHPGCDGVGCGGWPATPFRPWDGA